MKNFSKSGVKLAAAVAMSVLAMGYTTSVWAAEDTVVTKEETVFKDVKGTRTEILHDIRYRNSGVDEEKPDEVKASALGIYNSEKLNIVNDSAEGLYIGCQAIAKKNAEGIGINVNGAQADFDINGHFGVLAQGCIEGTEANVSIKAVGFSGEKGSSLIKAGSVGYVASNEDHRGISTGTLVEESLGMALNNYAMNIFAEKDINIYSFILNNTELTSKKTAQGMVLSNGSKASLQAGGQIRIEVDSMSNSKLEAINAKDSKLDMKAEQGIEIKAANIDAEGNVQADKVYAIVADNSEIALDGGSSGIYILGNVNVSNNSVLKLSGVTGIGGTRMRIGRPGSNLTVENSTLVVDGLVTTSGTTTLNNAKIYMYDANNAEAGFHALAINNLNIVGSNELFLRADSSKEVNNSPLNSDIIGISGTIQTTTTITGAGKFDVNVFDKGMKNGYGMSTDGKKELDNSITVLYNRNYIFDDATLINSVKDVHYDNGIWSYTYDDMKAVSDGNKIVIKEVNVKAAPSASGSQRSLHSANKAAAALAVDVFGEGSALREHLRDVREHKESENVWAKYHGGKLKADGVQLKYNGVELGYDAYVGNNWTFGVSGQQVRGNTQLDSGSGKAKTNVGSIYGMWQGDGGAYVNLEAKAGRVSSESKAFGGTVMQKISGEFSAPAYSVSAEYGSTHELPAAWYLEPAVRLSYVHMGAADYSVRTQETLARVANDSFDSIILRGGAKLGRRLGAKGSFYVKAAAVYDFGGDLATTVSADGRTAYDEGDLGGWGLEYGAGLEYKLGKAANISLDFERRSGGELKRDWGVNVGVNYSF